ncbi:hypothetical protein EVAR_21333_1 [Eumeta japonica]|uniref:Uncharacterized protein n=1 Tax=Eumeta variegata TaxID=151549 RepID=A0A4C1ZU98_EUMVA|nr:hypothetical protein EVAR_21333_1 [Eumeta japonica]
MTNLSYTAGYLKKKCYEYENYKWVHPKTPIGRSIWLNRFRALDPDTRQWPKPVIAMKPLRVLRYYPDDPHGGARRPRVTRRRAAPAPAHR